MLFVNDIPFENGQGIFPVIVFNRRSKTFDCLGTSFFINGHGIFVTARHVLDEHLTEEYMPMIVQQLSTGNMVSRRITNLCIHPGADIAIGLVGEALDPLTAKPVVGEIAPNFRVSYRQLPIGTPLMGFGYPKTKKTAIATLTTFHCQGSWSKGKVEDIHPEGFSKLKNSCYQTTMRIESGSSGGPVFKDGHVVGINSSSFDLTGEDIPISFITPIAYILDLQLPVGETLVTIREMEKSGSIVSDY